MGSRGGTRSIDNSVAARYNEHLSTSTFSSRGFQPVPSGRGLAACGRRPSGRSRRQMQDKPEDLSYKIFPIV